MNHCSTLLCKLCIFCIWICNMNISTLLLFTFPFHFAENKSLNTVTPVSERINVTQQTVPVDTVIFDKWLKPIQSADSIKRFKKTIDSLHKFFNSNAKPSFYKPLDTWQLVGYRNSGWHENFPGKRNNIDANFVANRNAMLKSGKDILKAFQLSDTNFPLQIIPGVYERGAPYNGYWTAILPANDYLLIRYVHSYPNGNQSSWYHESVYYFRKVRE